MHHWTLEVGVSASHSAQSTPQPLVLFHPSRQVTKDISSHYSSAVWDIFGCGLACRRQLVAPLFRGPRTITELRVKVHHCASPMATLTAIRPFGIYRIPGEIARF